MKTYPSTPWQKRKTAVRRFKFSQGMKQHPVFVRRDYGRIIPTKMAAGFSMVEVALALLIVGIAMLTILGMFPMGLEQNYRSISDTHSALFAEEVFNTLQVHSERNWSKIGANIISLSPAAPDNWYDPASLSSWMDDFVWTNIYCHPLNSNIVNHAFRYRMTLTTNDFIKAVTLRVWPGQFGITNKPAVFYSEFYEFNR